MKLYFKKNRRERERETYLALFTALAEIPRLARTDSALAHTLTTANSLYEKRQLHANHSILKIKLVKYTEMSCYINKYVLHLSGSIKSFSIIILEKSVYCCNLTINNS